MTARLLLAGIAAILLTPFAVSDGASAPVVRPASSRTLAEIGRSRVVSFEVDGTADVARDLETSSSDSDCLEVLEAGRVLAGDTRGYARVIGRRAGAASLSIGGSKIAVTVVPPRIATSPDDVSIRFLSPSDGAFVWGTIAVGFEVHAPDEFDPRGVRLHVSGLDALEPSAYTASRAGPDRVVVFLLDTTKLEEGPNALVATASDGETSVRSEPATVHVVRAEGDALLSYEAEADASKVKRPKRFPIRRGMPIGRDRNASDGAYVNNSSPYPGVCVPVTVAKDGWYQMVVRARGSRAASAYPTVAVVVDGARYPMTNGPVLSGTWHRVAVGVPFQLKKGERVLTPWFDNDFYAGRGTDRNLHLDRIELCRLPGAPPGRESVADETGQVDSGLRLAWLNPIDGLSVNGSTNLRGVAWWVGQDAAPAPRVTLEINGDAVATQRSGGPVFVLDPGWLRPGANRIRMIAETGRGAGLRRASTPVQTVFRWFEGADGAPLMRRRHLRFGSMDEAWEKDLRARLVKRTESADRRMAAFYSPGKGTLKLPATLTGRFAVILEARGQPFQGNPKLEVRLIQGDAKPVVLGTASVPNWVSPHNVGIVELKPGPKRIVVAYVNDHHVDGKGDRNVFLQALDLLETPPSKDVNDPVARIAYPADGHEVFAQDAVVIDFHDDREMGRLELLVDGKTTGQRIAIGRLPGRRVFSLLARGLAPGEHEITVVATDSSGRRGDSKPVKIVVVAERPAGPGRYERAVRLLDRFAWGPEPTELAAILTMGEDVWLNDRLSRQSDDAGDLAALGLALARFPALRNNYYVAHRVLTHQQSTPNPVRSRFLAWVENHFSTWMRKTEADRKWHERSTFAQLGIAPFGDLLGASARSPAMLRYLDQERSWKGRLNENYARELLELHTLGVHGGYDQGDVTRLASLLTGWMTSREGDGRNPGDSRSFSFRYAPALGSGDAVSVVGMAFPEAAAASRYGRVVRLLEMLAANPATARFICGKLAAHYLDGEPDEATVARLTEVYLETHGDLREVLKALARDPALFRAETPRRLAHPTDYALRLTRALGHVHPWGMGDFLNRSGFGVYDRMTPDGYPEADAEYADTNAMLQRWRYIQSLGSPLMMAVSDLWRGREKVDAAWAQRVVDAVAVRLTGRVLGERSNATAVDYISKLPGNRGAAARSAALFVARMPEIQER